MRSAIGLKSLQVQCIIGVHPHERATPQKVLFDVEVEGAFEASRLDERLELTADYERLAAMLAHLAEQRAFRLLESLADESALLILQQFPMVTRVRVTVRKPSALAQAESAYAWVERQRASG